MNTINATYTIPGCRDGLPVTKIFFINGAGRPCYFYSDGLTNIDGTPDDTGWTEGSCGSVSGLYDNQEQWRVMGSLAPAPYISDSTDGTSITFSANTYKSMSVIVIKGFGSVTQNGKTHTFPEGYSRYWSVTDLADNCVTIDIASDDSVVSILTTRI